MRMVLDVCLAVFIASLMTVQVYLLYLGWKKVVYSYRRKLDYMIRLRQPWN